MKLINKISQLHAIRSEWRDLSVAFVPTMGNLHAGHLALVQQARALAERVVVSIFVNPMQFGPTEDYAAYPRTLDRDRQLIENTADLLFAPAASEIYPHGIAGMTNITVPGLSNILCGASRPGHFNGVATIVTILLNLVRPRWAIFGAKDFQQLLIIRRMVADLHLPVEIVGCPTVRESDGLALSSRNSYLSAEQRQQAPHLARVLTATSAKIRAGTHDYSKMEDECSWELILAGFEVEYYAIRRTVDLALPEPDDRDLVILVAARLGRTRLIDNIFLTQNDGSN